MTNGYTRGCASEFWGRRGNSAIAFPGVGSGGTAVDDARRTLRRQVRDARSGGATGRGGDRGRRAAGPVAGRGGGGVVQASSQRSEQSAPRRARSGLTWASAQRRSAGLPPPACWRSPPVHCRWANPGSGRRHSASAPRAVRGSRAPRPAPAGPTPAPPQWAGPGWRPTPAPGRPRATPRAASRPTPPPGLRYPHGFGHLTHAHRLRTVGISSPRRPIHDARHHPGGLHPTPMHFPAARSVKVAASARRENRPLHAAHAPAALPGSTVPMARVRTWAPSPHPPHLLHGWTGGGDGAAASTHAARLLPRGIDGPIAFRAPPREHAPFQLPQSGPSRHRCACSGGQPPAAGPVPIQGEKPGATGRALRVGALQGQRDILLAAQGPPPWTSRGQRVPQSGQSGRSPRRSVASLAIAVSPSIVARNGPSWASTAASISTHVAVGCACRQASRAANRSAASANQRSRGNGRGMGTPPERMHGSGRVSYRPDHPTAQNFDAHPIRAARLPGFHARDRLARFA